jgi:hypothetical protein
MGRRHTLERHDAAGRTPKHSVRDELETEILVVGGGLGGVAAALAALSLGRHVVLTEELPWLGGQLTTQAVPPDEHPWIETTGCTRSYRALRDGIRAYYRRVYPLTPEAAADEYLNPGMGNVSPLCHEPRVAKAVIDELLAPYHATGRFRILHGLVPVAADVTADRVEAVTFEDLQDGGRLHVHARFVLDATETGDLLPLCGAEHVIGAESQAETGEPSALAGDSDPSDQQAISWCFVFSHHPGEDHVIERPAEYDFWREHHASIWPDRQLSWTTPHPISRQPETRLLISGPTDARAADDLWHYRRILYRRHFVEGHVPSDVVVANWPQLDYCLGPIVGVSDEERTRHLAGARALSLSFVYWMQTEAPTVDGGSGYPGLRLRGDVAGTDSGLAMAPYIRESRRVRARFTVTEQHVGVVARGRATGAEQFRDSVGVGSYRIDLHPSTAGRSYVDVSNWPFQIPLGSLIPIRLTNLLAAGKCMGSTHVTNGCYRLHPVEWNVGEAAGALAAFCLEHEVEPAGVHGDDRRLEAFQALLVDRLGIELRWPEAVRSTPRLRLFGVVHRAG